MSCLGETKRKRRTCPQAGQLRHRPVVNIVIVHSSSAGDIFGISWRSRVVYVAEFPRGLWSVAKKSLWKPDSVFLATNFPLLE